MKIIAFITVDLCIASLVQSGHRVTLLQVLNQVEVPEGKNPVTVSDSLKISVVNHQNKSASH